MDAHALQPIDLLNRVDERLGERVFAEHAQGVVRIGRPVHQRLARSHVVSLAHADVLTARDQIFACVADVGRDDDLAFALGILAERDHAFDLAQDRIFFRFARLENFYHARQSAGDVLTLGGLARNLRQHVAGLDVLPRADVQVRADRQRVAGVQTAGQLGRLAGVVVLDGHARPLVRVAELDDDARGQPGALVHLLLHGGVVDVAEFDLATDLGQDRHRVRIPLGDQIVRLDLGTVLLLQLGAIHHRIAFALPLAAGFQHLDHGDLAVAVHRHQVAFAVHDRLQVDVAQHAGVADRERGLLGAPAGGAADVEGTHGQLRPRLADGLRGDDADRLADVHHAATSQVAPVAARTQPALRRTRQRRADLDTLDAGFLDVCDAIFVDFLVGLDQHLVGERVADVVHRHAAQDALAQAFDDLAAFDQRRHLDAVDRAAILFADDRVLRHVHQAARQVAGVGRLERGVGQPFARAVRGDEVLQHRQPLAEVGGDGRFDDLAGRLRHQPAHPGELPDLLRAAARARVRHHVDRAESLSVFLQAAEHLAGGLVRGRRPGVHDLVVPFPVGNQAIGVLRLDFLQHLLRVVQELGLFLRDHHVLDADRDAGLGGVLEAEVLEPVGEDDRRLAAGFLEGGVDQLAEFLLLHHAVDLGERNLGRHDLLEQDTPDRGLDGVPVHAHRDLGLQLDHVLVVGDAHFLRAAELLAFALGAGPSTGHGVQTQHDVLRRADDRPAVRRRQDVVGGHHQAARLDLRLDRQWDMHRHLVAVEVGVVGHADERMQLYGLALDQDGLERLNAEPVQRRRAVQQHRVLADHLVEDVPHLRPALLDHLLGALDRGRVAALFQLVVDEGLEQLQGHVLRQAALMQTQFRTDDDDRPARIIDPLAEQILAKPPALALQHVGQRLERTLARAGQRMAAAAVVEQRVHRLLQHPLFVAHDDVRRAQLHEPFQPVVAVDDATVQVVQVGCGEAAPVERHERAQVGRDDRNDLQDHLLGAVARLPEGVDDLQPLGDFLALGLAPRLDHFDPQVAGQLLQVEVLHQFADGLGAHADPKAARPEFLQRLPIPQFAQQFLRLEQRLSRVDDDVRLEVQHALQVLERHVHERTEAAGQALEEPDVGDRTGQFDVAHALAPDLGLDDLDAAFFAHHAAVPHAFVLAAVALVVLGRPEDFCAEQPVAFGFERPVIDGFRLLDLAVGPRLHQVRGSQRNTNSAEAQRVLGFFEETQKIFHDALTSPYWSSSTSSTFSARLWSSRIMTLKDSGKPGSSTFSPLTMASYIRVRPATSSDLTVSISCRLYAAP